MVWFLALLLLGAAPQKWPIESLTVEGLKNYSQAQALAVTGLKVGQLAGTQDFEAARDCLLAAGIFETVGYRFAPAVGSNGYTASFQVVEVQPVYPVRIEGLNAPEGEIQAWLRKKDAFFGPRIPATEAILKRDAAGIEEYRASKGRKEKIEGRVIADSLEKFAIVFRPASGAPKVAEVRFKGNTVVPSEVLLNSFAGVAYGTVYSDAGLRQLLDARARPLYDALGRIRVAFPKLETEKAKEVEGLVVTVTVNEGDSHDLGEVRVEGESPVPVKELLKIGGVKSRALAHF